MSSRFVMLAVALPVLAVAFGIARSEYRLASDESWHFRVAGYDPRDLLRGHYIRYQLSYREGEPIDSCQANGPEPCCLCLTRTGERTPPAVRSGSCRAASAQCDAVLDKRHLPRLRRFYIPEQGRRELEQRVRDAMAAGEATIELVLDGDGNPQVKALHIGAETIFAGVERSAAWQNGAAEQ